MQCLAYAGSSEPSQRGRLLRCEDPSQQIFSEESDLGYLEAWSTDADPQKMEGPEGAVSHMRLNRLYYPPSFGSYATSSLYNVLIFMNRTEQELLMSVYESQPNQRR